MLEYEIDFMIMCVQVVYVGVVEVNMFVGLMFQFGDNVQQCGFFGIGWFQ